MANSTYMSNRRKYSRPQAMVWTDAYEISGGLYLPSGIEYDDFIILTDHNRSEISVEKNRIANRARTINGTMRNYHITDKKTYSVSWELLPSRAFDYDPEFNSSGIISSSATLQDFIVDNGASGVEMLNWHENHTGPFYLLLSYDKYNEFSSNKYNRLTQYSEVVHAYITSFSYNIVKRGGTNFDMWDIDIELEEV